METGAPGGDQHGLREAGTGKLRHQRHLCECERSYGVIRRRDLDERVEWVVRAEGLVCGGDRRIDHRWRMHEVTEVDDPGQPLRIVPFEEEVPGVDVPVDRRGRHERERRCDDGIEPVEPTLDEREAPCVGDLRELRPQLRQAGDVPEDRPPGERMGEARECLVDTRHRSAHGSPRRGREGGRRKCDTVDQRDELDRVVDALDRDRAGGQAISRPAWVWDRQSRVCAERVLHREDLHRHDACRVGRIADLEDERPFG